MRGTSTKAAGTGDQIKGKLQHAAGELTNNPELKAKGRGNKAKGKTKKATGRVQNAVEALKG